MKRFVLAALLCALPAIVSAQAAPTLTFTAKTTTGLESVIPEFTWSTSPAAASCTASGDAAWTGAKPGTGTIVLAAVSSDKNYTMACTWPGDTQALVSWAIPTTNTNGSVLTNLAGFKIKYGLNAAALDKVFDVTRPTAVNQLLTNLAIGTWTFGVLAYNADGAESALSNTATKTITSGTNITRSVTISVNPRPSAPTGTAVQ